MLPEWRLNLQNVKSKYDRASEWWIFPAKVVTCQRLHSVLSGEWRGRVAEGRTWKWRHHQPASSWIAMDWNCDQQQQFWSTLANAIIMRRSTYVPVSASRGRLGQPSLPPTMPWTWSSPQVTVCSPWEPWGRRSTGSSGGLRKNLASEQETIKSTPYQN